VVEISSGELKLTLPTHPGKILAAELKARNLSIDQLALRLRVVPNRISSIVGGYRNITADTALRLGRFFSMDPEFWMHLQMQYDLAKAQRLHGSVIEQEVTPSPPVSESNED